METPEHDLRTGRSVWETGKGPQEDAPGPVGSVRAQALRHDLSTDVLVIGAGISGAMAAEALTAAGLDVVVVDRRGPVQGSTLASTALLLYALDQPLHLLSRRIGRERAERVWRRSRLAVAALEDRTRRLGIRADMRRRPAVYVEGSELDADGLTLEANARRHAGFDVELLPASDVNQRFSIPGRTGLLGFGNLSADPRRLALGFLDRALERGAALHAPVDVTEVEPCVAGVTAGTRDGPTLSAKHLIYATGYEFPKRIPQDNHRILSTWVIATRPQPMRPALIWEAADPYLYVRTSPDGRVLCGGEDEDFLDEQARDALLPEKTAALEAGLAALLPDLDSRAELAWSASFGDSSNGLPMIGAVPGSPNCYALMGYGGNGITFSMMGAQILRGLITGEGDADAELFAFS